MDSYLLFVPTTQVPIGREKPWPFKVPQPEDVKTKDWKKTVASQLKQKSDGTQIKKSNRL